MNPPLTDADRIGNKLARMMASGKYEAPSPMDDLPMGLEFAKEMAKSAWCPQEPRALLIQWMIDASALLAKIQCSTSAKP